MRLTLKGVVFGVWGCVRTDVGSVDALCVGSSRLLGLVLSVVVGFVLAGRDDFDRGVKALVVGPVDPFRGGESDVGEAVAGPAGFDQLRFVKADLDSMSALSRASPTVPIEESMPDSRRLPLPAFSSVQVTQYVRADGGCRPGVHARVCRGG